MHTSRYGMVATRGRSPAQGERAGEVRASAPIGLTSEVRVMPKVTGAQWLAEAFEGYGVSHVFLVPAVLSQTLYEMEQRGGAVSRIVAHDEKSAAYMADGYARVSRRPGVVMCQHIGSSNLAAGLRDPYLAGS